jgi:hypothetical protein
VKTAEKSSPQRHKGHTKDHKEDQRAERNQKRRRQKEEETRGTKKRSADRWATEQITRIVRVIGVFFVPVLFSIF